MQNALETLPWVEKGSVKIEIDDNQIGTVQFLVSDKSKFRLAEVKEVLKEDFPNVKLKSGPS